MKWQHAVILESIWGTDSIIIHFPVLADGTPYSSSDLLTLLSFSLLLGQNYSKSNSLSPFNLLDNNFLSPIPLLLLLAQKFSKSNSNFAKIFQDNSKFCLSRKFIPTWQKHSKTIPNCVFVDFLHSCHRSIKRCPLTLASVLACADSADELRFWSMNGS